MAKDLKAFMKKASEDKVLAKKVNKAKNEQELRSVMASEGFELTDSDINNVSGGSLGSMLDIKTGDIKNLLSVVKQNVNQKVENYNIGNENKTNIDQKTSFS